MSEKVREKWHRMAVRRKVAKDKKLYEKYAGVRVSKPPKPLRGPVVFAMMILICMSYYLITVILVKGGDIEAFREYVLLFAGIMFASMIIMVREGTIASAGRTLKIKVGDMPAVVADGFVPGQNVKTIEFTGIDDNGEEFKEKRHFELAWGGPLKRWFFKGRGPAFVLFCQYNLNGGDKNPQAGFMMGDEYIVPLVPDAYRYDLLKVSRDSRFGKMLRQSPEISKLLHERTWVVLGTQPTSMPDRKVFPGSVIDDMELWHEKRLRSRTTDTLHGVGIDDKITKAVGVKK